MNSTEKKHLLKRNTALWIVAMVMPAFFSIALGGTRFPWPIVLPLLLAGLMLASNRMLAQALEESAGTTGRDID